MGCTKYRLLCVAASYCLYTLPCLSPWGAGAHSLEHGVVHAPRRLAKHSTRVPQNTTYSNDEVVTGCFSATPFILIVRLLTFLTQFK